MTASRSRTSAHLAGSILRTTGVVVSTPMLTRSRRNAARALHTMQQRHGYHPADAVEIEAAGIDVLPGVGRATGSDRR